MVINANNHIEQPRAGFARRERSLNMTRASILMTRMEEVV